MILYVLVFGLIINNQLKVPENMKAGGRTEHLLKIGLVCMGADIFFCDIMRGGFKRHENTARALIQLLQDN
jgi:hypothetical protein